MVKTHPTGAYISDGGVYPDTPDGLRALAAATGAAPDRAQAAAGTMAHAILQAHNQAGTARDLRLRFDCLTSHDITYVGIVQTARASGLTEFPIPYVLTNCHNSLCAVGGTINEDDHMFGLSAARRYGGIYVPPHLAVIHQYMREMMSGGGKMILGSDSHTRYGALGTMAVGEGGPELVKQLLGRTYDIPMPEVVAIHLTGAPAPGVGPQDVALAIIGAVFASGYVKNKVMEFVGGGIANLSADYRIGIDVMTTETTCLSSIWRTDETIRDYYRTHGREADYKEIAPAPLAYYDGLVEVDLGKIRPMIALPFHPSNVCTIAELKADPDGILADCEERGREQLGLPGFTLRDKVRDGKVHVQQGVIAGCAGGTYENLCHAADILAGHSTGNGAFSLSVYPASQPVNLALTENGVLADLMTAGAVARSAFCGPCFGAGDTPANNGLSIRHTTRNFPSREGSKPGNGQIASVALMDARSIAATARNGGVLTGADELDAAYAERPYRFAGEVYRNRCYNGFGKADPAVPLQLGPGIADWPAMQPLADDLLLRVACHITDPVTTTDELIPSGETSSFRSNPLGLAEFTLSRKDPGYVGRAKAVQALERARLDGGDPASDPALAAALDLARRAGHDAAPDRLQIGSVVVAVKPGDGSAREQAASCQKVLGGAANIAVEYATKRYRSNLINWGMLPLLLDGIGGLAVGDYIFIPGVRAAVQSGAYTLDALLLRGDSASGLRFALGELTDEERAILLAGCLINHYRGQRVGFQNVEI